MVTHVVIFGSKSKRGSAMNITPRKLRIPKHVSKIAKMIKLDGRPFRKV